MVDFQKLIETVHSMLPNYPWLAWIIIFLVFILTIVMILRPLIDYSIKRFLDEQKK